MQKLLGLLVGAAALAVTSLPANTAVIGTFGTNPTSAAGAFSNDPFGPNVGGAFVDQYTFDLVGAGAFITIATASNTFAAGGIGGPFGIQNFAAAIFQTFDGIIGNGDDVLKFGPQFATLCGSGFCQQLDGLGFLNPGNYYLQIQGTAGTQAGYGGNVSVAETPIPGAAFLFGSVIAGLGGVRLYRRRKTA